ncbi:MAG: PD-(D/E)XK nuclease family protein, partial [Microthrixaceae bacterium]
MSLPLPTSLSPSKVSSFKDCALAFRFSAIDKLPEPSSMPAVKGTTVHKALELLFEHQPDHRTLPAAQICLETALDMMAEDEDYQSLALSAAQAEAFAVDAS